MSATAPIAHYLREVESLRRYHGVSPSAALGVCRGFLFDPKTWDVSYIVLDADLPGKKQLLLPIRSVGSIDDAAQQVRIDDPVPSPRDSGRDVAKSTLGDSRNLIGRDLHGLDHPAGRVVDLLVNINIWRLRYLVVETATSRVLTDIEWCVSIGSEHAPPRIDLPDAAIATAPPYRGLHELCQGYEEALYRHYTQRVWPAATRSQRPREGCAG